jgi:membrane protease YdiL (CAAX protease family)
VSSFFERRPILAAVLVGLLFNPVLILLMLVFVSRFGQRPVDPLNAGAIILRLVITAALWLILRRHGWLSAAGFNGPAKWREPWLIWLPALLVFANLTSLIGKPLVPHPDFGRLGVALAWGASVAASEETAFRGVVLITLLSKFHHTRAQVIACVLLSSILFGLYHWPTHQYWQMNLSQWVYATFAGVGFSAVLLRTRSIWLGMAVHALVIAASFSTNVLLHDQTVLLGETGPMPNVNRAAILSVLVTLPVFLYGLHLLRDIDRLELRFPGHAAR